jgi:hypothetical protein
MSDEQAIALSPAAVATITAHCESTGLTRAAAVEDLLARGARQVDLREMREAVEDVRAHVIDTLRAVDALGPYAIAALSLMAHWSANTGTTKLTEAEYAETARDSGRANWDGHLLARGVSVPSRPASEQPSSAQGS